ncbi:MAG: RAMP superfamily CRISPR-associated protein [Thermoanaerobacteraceae bacterium]|nr:RAMP superfamily CRISPR-associated protein [Thermoanaerobacteraceae bacterium]
MKKRYKITVKLKSPMCIATGTSFGSLIDKYYIKDKNNKPYIPASTMKGIIKQNFISIVGEEHISNKRCDCPVCSLFGGEGYNPSRIYIEDLKLDIEDDYSNIRFSTSVDRYRGVTKDNSLFSTEVFESGIFSGYMEFYMNDKTKDYEELLRLSVKMIENIGSGKSRGYGWVDVDIQEVL